MLILTELLTIAIERNASDIHLISGYYPAFRINNELHAYETGGLLSGQQTQNLVFSILSDEQRENLQANKEIDFGYEYGNHRFRINVYYVKNALAAAFRLIPPTIRTIDELGLPSAFHKFANVKQGLILLTGPTGEGKSTTLASIINEINLNQSRHIITIEDPIEYVYPAGKSYFSQRELHQDTFSWTIALRSVLREDPDVVLVGEMRDYDTIQAVLTIAETGHLVFSTLHTNSTPEAINRIIDVFPAHQQNQVRSQLASVLYAVVSQRLLPNTENTGRVPAVEVLFNIPSVASIIREGKTFMLDNVLETEERQDMILFEKYLTQLYEQGKISKQTALTYALRMNEIKKLLT
ncbi:type IV pilus twitching motility protein PilT [Candidatus Roizmanbacteria bacterium]|nr:type IV pilus twitching motility protein PilT [Candidatus Roizmanbacteria bacterium]